MHYFSNDQDMRVEFDGRKKRKDNSFMYTYSLDDYPFTTILDSQKKDMRGELESNADTKIELLAKRRPITEILLPEGIGVVGGETLPFPVAGNDPNGQGTKSPPTQGNAPLDPTKKLGLPSTLCIPIEKRGGNNPMAVENMNHDDSLSQNSTAHFKNLDAEQAKAVELFVEEMNGLVKEVSGKNNRDPKRDEDLIVLLTLKRFVTRFFGTPGENQISLGSDTISRLMRSKVTVNDMILVLNSIKFRDKNSDMILVTVKQFSDIFLELIVSPQSFKPSQINFYRGGKSIVNLFIFLLKNFFQQTRLLKSISAEESQFQQEGSFLFSAEPAIQLLTSLIDTAMELCVLETPPGPVPNNNSAFQLHSQRHSQEHAPVPHETHESEGAMVSNNFLDRSSRQILT